MQKIRWINVESLTSKWALVIWRLSTLTALKAFYNVASSTDGRCGTFFIPPTIIWSLNNHQWVRQRKLWTDESLHSGTSWDQMGNLSGLLPLFVVFFQWLKGHDPSLQHAQEVFSLGEADVEQMETKLWKCTFAAAAPLLQRNAHIALLLNILVK